MRDITILPVQNTGQAYRMPLDQALSTDWPFDACFVAFDVAERQRKKQGMRSDCSWVLIDIDLNDKTGKVPGATIWTETPTYEQLPARMDGWAAWYCTPWGYRLVYQLNRPVPPEDHEGLSAWFREQLQAQLGEDPAWDIDDRCCDWTHLYRVPFGMRIDLRNPAKSWTHSTSALAPILGSVHINDVQVDPGQIPYVPAQACDVLVQVDLDSELPKLPKATEAATAALVAGMKPANTTWDGDRWAVLAQCILDQAPIPLGTRDDSAAKGTGRIAYGGRKAGLDKYETFAQCYEPFLQGGQLPPQDPTHILKAWNFFQTYWESDQAQIDQKEEVLEAKQEEAEQVAESSDLIDLWKAANVGIPPHWGPDEMAARSVLHMDGNKGKLILTADGTYEQTGAFTGDAMAQIIRDQGVGLVPTEYVVQKTGEVKFFKPDRIGTKDGLFRADITAPDRIFDGRTGHQVIFNQGFKFYANERFAQLNPNYQPVRSEWLEYFLNLSMGEAGSRAWQHWASMFLDVNTHALPCLILHGEAFGYKTTLVEALQSMLVDDRGAPCVGSTGFFMNPHARNSSESKKWGDGKASTFLWVEDDIQLTGHAQVEALMTQIRQMHGDLRQSLSIKGKGIVFMRGHIRMAIATNQSDLASQMIYTGGSSGTQSIEATRSRLLPLRMSREGADFLHNAIKENGLEVFRQQVRNHVHWLHQHKDHAAGLNGCKYVPSERRIAIPMDWTEHEDDAATMLEESVTGIEALVKEQISITAQGANITVDNLRKGPSSDFSSMNAQHLFVLHLPTDKRVLACASGNLRKLARVLNPDDVQGTTRSLKTSYFPMQRIREAKLLNSAGVQVAQIPRMTFSVFDFPAFYKSDYQFSPETRLQLARLGIDH